MATWYEFTRELSKCMCETYDKYGIGKIYGDLWNLALEVRRGEMIGRYGQVYDNTPNYFSINGIEENRVDPFGVLALLSYLIKQAYDVARVRAKNERGSEENRASMARVLLGDSGINDFASNMGMVLDESFLAGSITEIADAACQFQPYKGNNTGIDSWTFFKYACYNRNKFIIEYSQVVPNEQNGWTAQTVQDIAYMKNLLCMINYQWYNDFPETVEELNRKKDEIMVMVKVKMQEQLSDIFMEQAEKEQILSLLRKKKNVILQGAPGVGKTFAAKRFAKYLIIAEEKTTDDDELEKCYEERICYIQFHQSYSYEDFIMGLRPNKDGGFDVRTGVFYDLCYEAAKKGNEDKSYFIVIDEINRGQLSKIFGELFMLIEADKRGEENALKLLYADESETEETNDKLAFANNFYVPENVYLIGTMNTADRSLAVMDSALRRRFAFCTLMPMLDAVELDTTAPEGKLKNDLKTAVKKLNGIIAEDPNLGAGFMIGHSFFCTDETAEEICRFELEPLLDEYWYDAADKAEEQKKALRDAAGIRSETAGAVSGVGNNEVE